MAITGKRSSHLATTLLLVGFLICALPSHADAGGFASGVVLERNTQACGGGVRCEAFVRIPSSSTHILSRGTDISFTLTYLNGSQSPYEINYEIGERRNVTRQRDVQGTCAQQKGKDGTIATVCATAKGNFTTQEIFWQGQRLSAGDNILHLWTDEKPLDAVVDWNFAIKGVDTPQGKVDFDTHTQGWAIWGSSDYPWQSTSFAKRRSFSIADAGRTGTPVRVNISGLGAIPASGFAVYDSANASKPLSYLDANEHLVASPSNASYLLFTANSSETYFLYYNNNTPVTPTPAFLAWERFVNSSNNLAWTVQGGTWTFSSGYASKAASTCSGNVCGVKVSVPGLSALSDIGVFSRAYYATRGDSMRFGFSCGSTWNAQGIVDDFGPTNYRSFGAGTASTYSSATGSGGSTSTVHDYTIRYGTSAHVLYEDESTTPTATWTTPTGAQAFNPGYNATCMGGQEQGEGRFDDYALWNWALLGRVNFYDSLTTGYALGSAQDIPAAVNETEGRAAILSGIASSEIGANSTSYQDRQVAIRLANGTQYLARFDVFVAGEGRRWAFGYDPNATAALPSFANITPVFWFWQGKNMTAAALAGNVSGLINATN